MNTYHIHIKGVVQGVGFRPFIFKLATSFKLKGWINNGLDGIHVEFNSNEKQAQEFYKEIIEKAPSNARLYSHSLTQKNHVVFNSLKIIKSEEIGEPDIPLTPDFALCPTCKKELSSPKNRRFQYPFITCTYCGPRYSIAQNLPYDRYTTTMHPFTMCHQCQIEYDDPLDRRYYSQTNSCQTCGITLEFIDFSTSEKGYASLNYNQTIELAVDYIKRGNILAVKGIGGYLLVCDAANPQAIEKLRKRKHRPTKPFAVMYPTIEQLQNEFKINKEEEEALTSEVAFIVLLQKKEGKRPSINVDLIAPGLIKIGCMIPYAPLFQLILDGFGKPIIATSGNISGSPIIYEDEAAKEELQFIADGILMHNRKTVVPQDDSVISFTSQHNHRIIHRRSRGLAPTYTDSNFEHTNSTILATGSQMKSSFSMLTKNRIYISQYLGDMDSFLTQNAYYHTFNHLESILSCQPNVIITDKHPNYFTTEWGQRKAQELNIPIYQIQHHQAHFAAVLTENNLLESLESILGVIWDGTGMGNDQQIWGGEFFLFQNKQFERKEHIGYFPFILGDKMPKEPRISALCICNSIVGFKEMLKQKFTSQEWNLYKKILSNDNHSLTTSSMGRLFDAVASLLLNINKISYEGEAAIQLENLAKGYKKSNQPNFEYSYFRNKNELPSNKATYIIEAILSDLKKGVRTDKIAYSFHISLVDLVRMVATKNAFTNIAFSGGVFENELLTDMMISLLQSDFKLFFHKQLSPNDENISLGQLAIYMLLKE
ncbi:MAG: carbamoyltransferase HypF [Cyclobacteriaceae bacterium]|nr:carbamoyltransferase HypF [Cyclobacteriaceae bacterium]